MLTRVRNLSKLPDLLHRSRIPADLESVAAIGPEAEPTELGLPTDYAERIWQRMQLVYRSGVHPAIQVCVRRHGEVVFDRALGHAHGNGPDDAADTPKVPVTPSTPFVTYSASKGVTAFVVHLLVDRGLIDLHAPICKYIPEYGCHGKESITVGHVLAHRSGVANLPREALTAEAVADRELLVRNLCAVRPSVPPGRFQSYHALSGGFILGEVVYRVTGKDIRTVLDEEILRPLSFRWTNYGVAPPDLPALARNYRTGLAPLPPLSLAMERILGVSFTEAVETGNDPAYLGIIAPAANVVSTANELSRFYEIFRRGGELDGVRVVRPETIAAALVPQSRIEPDLSLGMNFGFGYGPMLGGRVVSLYGPDTRRAFGHLGFTNNAAWADPERALSCAVLTSGKPILYPELIRWVGLLYGITSETPKVAETDLAF
ncbi:serine hydrolase domain-containing protein [Nocardia iowensis]|uniref:Beta-lactamase family protein n=1 Tax=Nocardia iowensis TaxID=204891 RepID=A0ABX8RRV9_NOCIO|nr:serine hydrolase domain-containing protein [Nocardia iowensis]QXN92380.1 beta-lactamase family protein [Nocardia iowensis]